MQIKVKVGGHFFKEGGKFFKLCSILTIIASFRAITKLSIRPSVPTPQRKREEKSKIHSVLSNNL